MISGDDNHASPESAQASSRSSLTIAGGSGRGVAVPKIIRKVSLGRRAFSIAGWALTSLGVGLMVLLVGSILWTVFVGGWSAMSPSLFTTVTQGTGGGLLNAIEGTAVLSVGALLLAVPLGVAAGVYVAEYRYSRWARAIRFVADVLVGVPSIVLGYFGYVTMVEGLGWNF